MSLADKIFSTSGKGEFNWDLGVYPAQVPVIIQVSTNSGELTPPENTNWFIKTSHRSGDLFKHIPTITSAMEQVFYEYTNRLVTGYKIESTVSEGVITHTVSVTSWGPEELEDMED